MNEHKKIHSIKGVTMKKTLDKENIMIRPMPVSVVSCGNIDTGYNWVSISWCGNISTSLGRVYISVNPKRYSCDIIRRTKLML